jgi:hypothetical protein
MRLSSALSLALALVPGVSWAGAPPRVPEPFQGRWARDPDACRTLLDDASVLWIGEARLSWFRASGPVLAVRAAGPGEVVVTARIEDHWGPAETRTRTFRLSGDGERLTEAGEGGATVERRRCPALPPVART